MYVKELIFFSFILFSSVISIAQIHSEIALSRKLLIDSTQNIRINLSDSLNKNCYFEVGTQYVHRISTGRNSATFYSQPGIHTYLEGAHSLKIGKFALDLNPVLISVNPIPNHKFSIHFPTTHPVLTWKNYLELVNRYDNSDYAKANTSIKLFGGNSSITAKVGFSAFRLSTAQLDWGVAIGDRLVVSSNAPGFPHVGYSFQKNTKNNSLGIRLDVAYGFLKSPIYQYDDNGTILNGFPVLRSKNSSSRTFSGFDLKFILGKQRTLLLGLNYATLFYYNFQLKLPVLNYLFSFKDITKFQQLSVSSFYLKKLFPLEKLQIWAEYGFQNRSFFPHYLLINDSIPRGYVLGALKSIALKNKSQLQIFFQFSSLGVSTQHQAMQFKGWYLSKSVTQGYTNYGRVIGSGIGPGSETFYLAVSYLRKKISASFYMERYAKNQDFTYATFNKLNNPINDYRRHWIDFTNGLTISRWMNMYDLHFNLAFIHSFNYQWLVQGPHLYDYGFDKTGIRGNISFRRYLR